MLKFFNLFDAEEKKFSFIVQCKIDLGWQSPEFCFLDHGLRGTVAYALVKWSA